jgi:hypothetical protein
MLKHLDDVGKSARERARRRWQNYATEKAFKAAQQEAADGAAKEPKEPPSPADVLEQEKLIKEATTKFESKFLKDIRAMMEGHSAKVLALYLLSLRAQRKRLLQEKLRRLEALEAQRVAQQTAPLKRKDLFS